MLIVVSICPHAVSSSNNPAPISDPSNPPAISTAPMRKSTPPRSKWASAPETLAPVTCVAADAAATVGGIP